MAITVQAQITGQDIGFFSSYCYLFEPLNVVITESDAAAKKIFIDIRTFRASDGLDQVGSFVRYGDFDINSGQPLEVDLMTMARQLHAANVYRFGTIEDIVTTEGEKAVVSEFRYNFRIYSDVTTTPTVTSKLPIIGGRFYKDFSPQVLSTNPTNEFEVYNVDISNRWNGYKIIGTTLSNPVDQDATPTMTLTTTTGGKNICGGYVIWKSALGGWCSWGFEQKTERTRGRYVGNLDTGLFEATQQVGGNPYIETNYTQVQNNFSVTLKSLSLSREELNAVASINQSPAVYYQPSPTSKIELMRLTSATVPLDSRANGGDFTVSLDAISSVTQNVR